MGIDHSGVRMPARYELLRAAIVQLGVDVEEAPEFVVRADIVSGRDLQTAEAARQHVLGGSATNATRTRQELDRRCVIRVLQRLKIELARDDRPAISMIVRALDALKPCALSRLAERSRAGSGNARGPAGS